MHSLGQPAATVSGWRKATAQAAAVVYAPFAVVAFYTLLFVPCPHCKRAICELLPVAPGLFPSQLVLSHLWRPAPSAAFWIASGLTTLLATWGLAFGLRRGGRWRRPILCVVLVIGSVLAVFTLLLIRA
jgi:hypothetical protein